MPSRIKILTVDDKPAQLVALEAALADVGEVVRATSGREALRRLLEQEFAVILMDVNMPDMNGFETARLIRQRKKLEHTPIIFLTAYPDELLVARGYSLGAVDYILAPVVPEILRAKVRVFVELYRKSLKIRKQAVRLRKRAAQLGALTSQLIRTEERERRRLAQILHDHVQQLLTAARMRIQLARNMDEGSVSTILDEVEQLIADSIGAARSLSVELHPPILEIGGLVQGLEWLARHFRKTYGLDVDIEAKPICEPRVAHRVFLFDAVRELLLNVVKHSGVEKAKLFLSESEPDVLRLVVHDSGSGFDAKRLASERALFEHSGLRTLGERAGALGGRLELESAPGKGTRTLVEVPHARRAPEGLEGRPRGGSLGPGDGMVSTDPSARTSGRSIRILLAEDHEIVRKGLISLLQSQSDMEVVGEAPNGRVAVELAHRLKPDVIVMDLSMPDVNGVEATRRISAELPAIRVVGLSMDGGEQAASAIRRAGAVAHVFKGGPPEELLSVIRDSCS